MSRQGVHLDHKETANIVKLLHSELTLGEIATRTGLSKTCIVRINRVKEIRRYKGQRTTWNKKQ